MEGVISQVLLRRADGRGRVAAFEIMTGTTAIRNLIRENKVNQINSFLETGSLMGMTTLDKDIQRLLGSGVITLEESLAKAKKRSIPQMLIRR